METLKDKMHSMPLWDVKMFFSLLKVLNKFKTNTYVKYKQSKAIMPTVISHAHTKQNKI